MQPRHQVGAQRRPVDDPGRDAFRVEAEPHHVDRRLEQMIGDARQQKRNRPVRRQEGPVPVDRQGGIRLVPGEDQVDRLPRRCQRRILQAPLGEDWREPARQQQRVPLPQGHIQMIGQAQQEVPARPRASRLQETQVPGRHSRLVRQGELAEMPSMPPVSQHVANGAFHGAHDAHRNGSARTFHLPWR